MEIHICTVYNVLGLGYLFFVSEVYNRKLKVCISFRDHIHCIIYCYYVVVVTFLGITEIVIIYDMSH